MPKCSLKRILQLRVTTCMTCVICLILTIQFLSCYGTYKFNHIPEEKLQEELYRATVPNLVKKANVECKYDEILNSTKSVENWEAVKPFDDFLPTGIVNGSFVPSHCNPAFSVAILVTYRNRQKQLDLFLPYIHNFLRKQNIHYKIYVIEQQDEKPWNKGLLYNEGARRAVADGFPCLVLHDVDLLPLDRANLYACTSQPRHMSASLDKFRYMLPYDILVGGVLAIRSEQFVAVDGFSTRFLGWGGEDDDFALRLAAHHLSIQRFPRTMCRYTMLRHSPEPRNGARKRIMRENLRGRRPADGYSARAYTALTVRPHRLFTLLTVIT